MASVRSDNQYASAAARTYTSDSSFTVPAPAVSLPSDASLLLAQLPRIGYRKPPLLDLPRIEKGFKQLRDSLGRAVLNAAERSAPRRTEEALRTLDQHALRGSFLAHARHQLKEHGRIYVGVIDNFDTTRNTHGGTVAQRILATVPDYLRPYVEIVPFDISGGRTSEARQLAIQSALRKEIVALSVSGGLPAVDKEGLEKTLGERLSPQNRQRAFWAALGRFKDKPDYAHLERDMMGLMSVSRLIPVVSPVWNDGLVTPLIGGGGAGGPIVTSIEETHGDTRRTEAPGMVDFEAPTNSVVRSPVTSQSPPYFIGQILGGLGADEVKRLTSGR
jgi:hypothetical protein